MMRKMLLILLGLALVAALAACDTPENVPGSAIAPITETLDAGAQVADTTVAGQPAANQPLAEPVVQITESRVGETAVAVVPPVASQLTTAEIDALNFMREEEKMARDVYLTLYDMWGLPIFQNIATSEQNHIDSVLTTMQKYGLPDLASGNPQGVFVDPTLQNLHDEMISQGSQSLLDALRVGAAIEEVDIIDLDARLHQTGNTDIQQTLANLRSGSENHLRSFVAMLERQTGEVYTPQYLPEDAYAAIMSGETGRNSNGQAGTGSGSGGQNLGQGGQSGQSQPGSGQGNGGRGRWGSQATAQP